ncbi:hypothetical protein [Flavobacterium crassostreae]|uniref:Outer membrane protein beta-barrel domain-containing protein n=1 Tax=Flavobacterium crassostreae TaxID=1763534 RepID=A0A1B9E7J5_9FLAO|nr:hypothetical protein [Flavobacterium crassostreae]OCB77927.1 hypothetical protein LPBF_02980 [Flavobacterium crassostreae]
MKKIILTVAAVFAFGIANAQEGQFKIGAHVGLPMGDIKDAFSLNVGADVAYLWEIDEQFKVGATTGYTTFLGKTSTTDLGPFGSIEVKTDPIGFLPLAGTAQYTIAEDFFIGADLGYAIYVGKGTSDGGVYYQPKFGYQTDKFEVFAGYKGISRDGGSISSLNLGFNYKL